jgi:hypothetical protein
MKDPNYPSSQPKNGVDEALVDRNSDPDAINDSEPPLKKHGDALLDGSGSRQGESPDQSQRTEER